jgi:predicted transcriptional regulator
LGVAHTFSSCEFIRIVLAITIMAHYVMQKKGLDHLLVIDHEGRLAGTVSRKSLFNVMDENKSQGI